MDKNVGVAILTYNRPDYYKQVLSSIPRDRIGCLLVVNDGEITYVNNYDADHVIYNQKQLGIAKTKNRALKFLYDNGYENIFLIEDDVIIKNPDVFDVYIKHAETFGIHHLNFLKIAGNEKTLRFTRRSTNGCELGFYRNPQGAFSYFNYYIIKKFGYFDENYVNAFEHIDYEYLLSEKNAVPPFWYFPDVLNSEKYLTTIEGSDQNSTITNKNSYEENWQLSANHFIKKWGKFTNQIDDRGENFVRGVLNDLETVLSRKKLVDNGERLSIVIPYRDRESALSQMIPILFDYVSNQVTNFDISVIEQDDNKPFNKGLLNNIGVLLNIDSDYFCIHDVDLIPEFSDYSYPKNPTHLSKYCSQFNYIEDPAALMGGVVLFKKEDFLNVNGYPNDYIYWGSEDNTLANRCIKKGLEIFQHPSGQYKSIPHRSRLEDKNEYEGHIINGKKREDEKNGITKLEDNGIQNIDLSNFSINIEKKEKYNLYKIRKNE